MHDAYPVRHVPAMRPCALPLGCVLLCISPPAAGYKDAGLARLDNGCVARVMRPMAGQKPQLQQLQQQQQRKHAPPQQQAAKQHGSQQQQQQLGKPPPPPPPPPPPGGRQRDGPEQPRLTPSTAQPEQLEAQHDPLGSIFRRPVRTGPLWWQPGEPGLRFDGRNNMRGADFEALFPSATPGSVFTVHSYQLEIDGVLMPGRLKHILVAHRCVCVCVCLYVVGWRWVCTCVCVSAGDRSSADATQAGEQHHRTQLCMCKGWWCVCARACVRAVCVHVRACVPHAGVQVGSGVYRRYIVERS